MLIKTAAIALISVVSIGLFEGLCTAWAWCKYGTVNVESLNAADRGMSAAVSPHGTALAETRSPHPWLGIVPNVERLGEHWGASDVAKFPLRRDPEKFTVLLVGGSVASHLGRSGFLKDELNQLDFGKPVEILNAACGATTQPRQAIALLLYADVVDAVICLDGFNESSKTGRCQRGKKLGVPGSWFCEGDDFDSVGRQWLSNKMRGMSNSVDSRAVFLTTAAIRNGLRGEEREDSADSAWSLPDDWTEAEKIAWNMDRYRYCLRSIRDIAKSNGLRDACFIQPCPAVGKALTPEEKRVSGALDYGDSYRTMASGLPAISLLDCFDGVGETVYTDAVHNNDLGKRIMAERIASELARLWQVQRKQDE